MPRERSAPPRSRAARGDASSRTDREVVEVLRELDHPLKREIGAVRDVILAASPAIREGIKWNAPSFRTTEFFATFNLRARDRVQLVLHRGAKSKDGERQMRIPDPEGLLDWRSSDRCLLTLPGGDVADHSPALRAIIRAWIRQL